MKWVGECGSPPRGQSHAIVGYDNGKARAACGVRFRLHDNHWLDAGDPLTHPQYCARCRARIESGAVEDVRF